VASAAPTKEEAHGVPAVEVRGEFVSESPLECVATSEVTPDHTPADIYPAVAKCLRAKRLRDAVSLYAVAYAYAMFDVLRVRDASAHQAKDVLELQAFAQLEEADRGAFIAAVQGAAPGTEAAARVCGELARLGPPSYAPRYMIAHGAEAASGNAQQAPPESFDPAAAWTDVLASKMKCG
jgi:hypothetical protein